MTGQRLAVPVNVAARSKLLCFRTYPRKDLIVSVLLPELDTEITELGVVGTDVAIVKVGYLRSGRQHFKRRNREPKREHKRETPPHPTHP
ncbi:MAG: hypothetical protein ACKOQZ_04750 [Actinomycetota bacterium]